MSATPWIVATQHPWGLWCRRCDGRLEIAQPVTIGVYGSAAQTFAREHADCEPLPAATEVKRAGGARLPGFDPEGGPEGVKDGR